MIAAFPCVRHCLTHIMTLSAINSQGGYDGDMSDSQPARGRPSHIDPAAIADAAIALFQAHGYDAISMDRVAEEAGISRRSLFRYFPAKGDLVWHGSAPVEARLHGILTALPAGALTYAVLTDAVVDSLHALDHREGVTRARLRLIASHADLLAQGPTKLATFWTALADFLTAKLRDPHRARVLALAIRTVVFDALLRWAAGEEHDFSATVSTALESLGTLGTLSEC
ncbi:TetR family transcriptional regulator [Mycetocola lacteus]|uniref:TetR family transcriptional regulator n=2 Tax=Mycetocola lacteus TaxID=76637 RepID=A0A3L7AJI7_9MICO|nr:TetR family transcriptional regulator [Mycetocola lacteus]